MIQEKYITNPLRRLISYASPYRLQIAWASLCSILNKIFDIMPEVLIGVAVDTVVNRQASFVARMGIESTRDQLLFLGVLTMVIWGCESLFQYLYQVAWRNLAQRLQHGLRSDAYAHIQRLDMAFFEDKSSGTLMSILNDDVNQLERFLDGGANNFIQLMTSNLAIGAIFLYLAPQIALFALFPIPVILILAYAFQHRLGPRYLSVRDKAGRISARLSNNLSGMATIKSYTAEDFELARLNADSMAYEKSNREAIRLSSAFIPIVRMAIVCGFVMTLVLGGFLTLDGQLEVGGYSVLVFLTQRLLWPFTLLAEMTDLYQRAMASTRRVLGILQMPIQANHTGASLERKAVKGEIEFRHVDFTYPNGAVIFRDLSFHIASGETVAFVGATGSGKTTLTKLMLGFYQPNNGQILIDNIPMSAIKVEDVRKVIGFIGQDVFLFDGSVYENISYGSFNALDIEVRAAAKIAEAHEFITTLPQGYQTVVGERGQKLSGGQRQRISIARAVLKDPPILILDEATSAVDNETEAAIQRSINKIAMGRTMIVIAHRLSTIRHAHVIHVMDKGQIVESGTHEELLAQKGVYANLWRIQSGELGG